MNGYDFLAIVAWTVFVLYLIGRAISQRNQRKPTVEFKWVCRMCKDYDYIVWANNKESLERARKRHVLNEHTIQERYGVGSPYKGKGQR